jgi:hypothetical protein
VILLVVLIGWWAIGAYVVWAAVRAGHVPGENTIVGWIFGAAAWPWVLLHVRKVKEENTRMQPFEDWAEKYDQEQIDKRLDDLK